MPIVGSRPHERSDPSRHMQAATAIGCAVCEYYGLDPTATKIAFKEPNSKGLLFVLKSGTRQVKPLVVDTDGSVPHPKATNEDVLRELLGRADLPPGSKPALEAILTGPPVVPAEPGRIRSIADLKSIYAKPTPIRYLVEGVLPEAAISVRASRLRRVT